MRENTKYDKFENIGLGDLENTKENKMKKH